MVGSVIENYKIISVLGEGGMGVVYKALDMKLERFVALKILSAQSASNPQFIERFKREARNQAKLNHPNIVPVYGFTDENGVLGIVMEYVEGETLEKLIYRKKRLEHLEALKLTKQILEGVGYAHTKGFIHRDIKPSNIIINKDGIIKIMDFGISKSMFDKGITKTGTKIGTILYMSPEQIRADEPTRQSDIYSIGVTFYEMLVGKTPFDFGTEYEIMEAHLKKNPGRVSVALDSVPPEIDKIVAKSLEKTQAKRYPTCEEFISDINHLIGKIDKNLPSRKVVNDKLKENRSYKMRVTFMTAFTLIAFIALAYFFFNQIKDVVEKFRKPSSNTIDTTAGMNSGANLQLSVKWTKLNTNCIQNLNSIYFVDNNFGFACGDAGSVLSTSDAGETWKTLPFPDSIALNDIFFFSAQNGLTAGEKGKIFYTNDGGTTWTPVLTNVSESILKISFLTDGSGKGFAVGSKGLLLRTLDKGISWVRINTGTDRLFFSISFPDNQKGFIVGKEGTLMKTEDSGNNWSLSQLPIDNYLKEICFIDSKHGYICGAGGKVFKTSNGGIDWVMKETPISSGLSSILFVDAANGFTVSSKGEILSTTDGGDKWEIKQENNYNSLSRLIKTQNNVLFSCGSNGIILRSK